MKLRNILLLLQLIIVTNLFGNGYRPEDIPNVHIQNRARYVSNPDNILSPIAEARIDSTLSDIWKKTSAEAMVVIVNNIDGDIDDFATKLFSDLGNGKRDKDNGLAILIISK